MKSLLAKHILSKCSRCYCLRVNSEDQFICSLSQDNPGEGIHALLELKKTHRGVNIDLPKCDGRANMIGLADVINEVSLSARHFGRGLVGFSTGCLYQSSLPLVDKLKAYLRAGSTVLELSFARPNDLLEFEMTEPIASKLRKFSKITIHAPWIDVKYFDGSNLTRKMIDKIIRLSDLFFVSGIVVHPDVVLNFAALEMVPLPILIENMDKNKKYGISVDHIARIKEDYDLNFILDLQHAFEWDPSLTLAHEMISCMGNRIRHLHVSGETKSMRHAPVYLADNRKDICDLLKMMPSVPVVLEGVISDNILATAKCEFDYVTEQGDPLFK